MRLKFIVLLILRCHEVKSQKIEYRNDSLFINNLYADAQTSKSNLDSILSVTGEVKVSKDELKQNPRTGKKVKRTTYFYHELGLFFRKDDSDTTQLSIGIKLYRDTDTKKEKRSELKNTFKGELYIAENLINGKRNIEELKNLKNCSVTVYKMSFGTHSSIIGGDIIYKLNLIRIPFDTKTSELKDVFIHHNFRER